MVVRKYQHRKVGYSRPRRKSHGQPIAGHPGIFEQAQAQAIREVVAWQPDQATKSRKMSKNRTRLLAPGNDITLASLQRAAAMLGRRVVIELV